MDTNIWFQLVAFGTGKLEIVPHFPSPEMMPESGLLVYYWLLSRAANATSAAQLTKLFNFYIFRLLYSLNISTRIYVQWVSFIHIYVLRALRILAAALIKE